MSASPECKNTDHGNQGLSLCPWVPGLALKGHPGTTAELSASCYTPPRHSTLTATEWTALRARSYGCAAPCPLARRGPHPAAAGQRLFGLQRIVDDDKVGTTPGQHPADRGGEPAALGRGLELGHHLPLRRKAGRTDLPVPVVGEDPSAIARQFVGEVLHIAGTEDLGVRVMTQTPSRKADRGQMRPSDAAVAS